MPVDAPENITEYSETMVFNKTLKRYSAHLATDFFAQEGTPVKAVYEGKIEKVENNLLTGVSITIDHGDGLKTVYNSIESGDLVEVGQTVSKGQVIGHVSVSNRQESGYGAHLHFEVIENGETIDPVKYLVIDEK
jgi:murein DD-endopeptidase MepM/ murein hydrolase activator NlpD